MGVKHCMYEPRPKFTGSDWVSIVYYGIQMAQDSRHFYLGKKIYKKEKITKENFRADLYSRTSLVRVNFRINFHAFSFSARICAKITTRENLYD